MLVGAWLARDEPTMAVLLPVIAAIFVLLALMFRSLTICDEGEWLALRYGPLTVFRKRICYSDITSVEPAGFQSSTGGASTTSLAVAGPTTSGASGA